MMKRVSPPLTTAALITCLHRGLLSPTVRDVSSLKAQTRNLGNGASVVVVEGRGVGLAVGYNTSPFGVLKLRLMLHAGTGTNNDCMLCISIPKNTEN